ncbi:MAG: glycosyl transferase, partial [Hyphomicrobiales bacterium]|nr:glycosyl transferase [Hyphomicrobiales bacterium]
RRLVVHGWYVGFMAEYPVTQFMFATPPIAILGWLAIGRFVVNWRERDPAGLLLAALTLPIALYFFWHTLHGRVEGNWPMPMYPAVAVAAAAAVHQLAWGPRTGAVVCWSWRLAAPVGAGCAAVIYVQALLGVLPLGPTEPTARALGAGWPQLARQIDAERQRIGAPVVLTADYGLTAWLSFYLPSHSPVEQMTVRMRWVNEPAPNPKRLPPARTAWR